MNFWEEPDQPALTDLQIKLYDRFVEYYLYDKDAHVALIRCGFSAETAKAYVVEFLGAPYVQNRIYEQSKALASESNRDALKGRVFEWLTLLSQRGSYEDQLKAVSKLAQILDMEPVKKTSVNGGVSAGSVLMVPTIASMDDWEKIAQQQQADLVADA